MDDIEEEIECRNGRGVDHEAGMCGNATTAKEWSSSRNRQDTRATGHTAPAAEVTLLYGSKFKRATSMQTTVKSADRRHES